MKNGLTFFIALLLSYSVAELTFSALVVHHVLLKRTYWFTEAVDPRGHIQLDPQIGYRMSPIGARYGAVSTDGRLLSKGMLFGNNYGLPDKRDFLPHRSDSTIFRIAVLGDSFTASQFTNRTWLECFEDSLNRSLPDSIELLNFSVDGGGLANWHGIVKHILVKDSFELDAVIYAVIGGDLGRTFHFRHEFLEDEPGNATEKRGIGLGYTEDWNEERYPTQPEASGRWFFMEEWQVLSSEEVNQIEAGNWSYDMPWRPYFLNTILETAEDWINVFIHEAVARPPSPFEPGQQRLIKEMDRMHRTLGVPVLCFSLPGDPGQCKEASHFAEMIHAGHIREQGLYYELGESHSSMVIEGDGHWNDAGAKAFAKNNHDPLSTWITQRINAYHDK
ncbi:MAG: hypothetical protein H6603_08065 [Flavobacteriales bacterium]|nr:hypothetical protein [Flavobacteriales bacterium]